MRDGGSSARGVRVTADALILLELRFAGAAVVGFTRGEVTRGNATVFGHLINEGRDVTDVGKGTR